MAKKNFTRKDLSNKIYQNLGFSKSYSSIVIDNFFETMIQELLRSNKIKVSSFGTFKVIYKKEFGFLTYPLSGGFRTWTLLPSFLYPLFLKIEKYLETYLARHVSFRMLVVLEKINVP